MKEEKISYSFARLFVETVEKPCFFAQITSRTFSGSCFELQLKVDGWGQGENVILGVSMLLIWKWSFQFSHIYRKNLFTLKLVPFQMSETN